MMDDFERQLRERLDRRAHGVNATPDRVDLDERIVRSQRRHEALRNISAVAASAVVVVAVATIVVVSNRGDSHVQSATPTTPTPTTQPVGTGAPSRAAITAAYDTLFQPGAPDAVRLAVIDDTTDLQPVVDLIRRIAPVDLLDTVRVRIDEIEFTDARHARVAFTITSTSAEFRGQEQRKENGGAVYEAGRWRVTRISFCQVIADAGVFCPEHEPPGYVPPSTVRLPATTLP
jgi:hypothetical protein